MNPASVDAVCSSYHEDSGESSEVAETSGAMSFKNIAGIHGWRDLNLNIVEKMWIKHDYAFDMMFLFWDLNWCVCRV